MPRPRDHPNERLVEDRDDNGRSPIPGIAVGIVIGLFIGSLLFYNIGPYGFLECRNDGMTYSQQPGWPDLQPEHQEIVEGEHITFYYRDVTNYAAGHCRARSDAIHPVVYDIRQKAEFALTGDYKPPAEYMPKDETGGWINTTKDVEYPDGWGNETNA